jgi:hypothetical protein
MPKAEPTMSVHDDTIYLRGLTTDMIADDKEHTVELRLHKDDGSPGFSVRLSAGDVQQLGRKLHDFTVACFDRPARPESRLAIISERELMAELERRGTVVYLAERAGEIAKECPGLNRADILAGMRRIKEAIGNSSIPEALGDIAFSVLSRNDDIDAP